MKVLVTGSHGQLGKELIIQLNNNNRYDVACCDIDSLDISNMEQVEKFVKNCNPDIIINCAAYTAVDDCESNVDLAYKANALGPRNLAVVSNDIGAKIIQISTDYVFDGMGIKENGVVRPYIEFDKPDPQSVYGKSKLEGEKFVRSHNPRHFIVRTAWLYGDGNNFVKTMIALSEKYDELKVVDDQTGSPTSTYELAKAIILLIDSNQYGTYHGTCEGQCTWYEFTKEIFRIKGIETKVSSCTTEEFPRPAKRPEYSVLNNYMYKLNFDYVFSSWEDAIYKYLKGDAK